MEETKEVNLQTRLRRLNRIKMEGIFQRPYESVGDKLVFAATNGTHIERAKEIIKQFCTKNKVCAILHFNKPHYLIKASGEIINLGECHRYDSNIDLASDDIMPHE